ncbi:MAG: hypothetical protein V3U92_06910 [Cellulophaga sp.]
MTLYDYLMLEEHYQAILLAEKGECIASYDNGETEFVLFALSNIFVELEKDKTTQKMIGRKIFKTGVELDKYLPGFLQIII